MRADEFVSRLPFHQSLRLCGHSSRAADGIYNAGSVIADAASKVSCAFNGDCEDHYGSGCLTQALHRGA